VESVAWIAERKDVLSGVFFMLTLGAYVRYVRRQTLGRYAIMWMLFACGLMSKPMLVTLPFVLLLLDYWPLNRVTNQRLEVGRRRSGGSSEAVSRGYGAVVGRLILEKVPLLILCVLSSIATLLAQGSAIASISRLPFWWRLNNAFLSYVVYVRQMLWPFRLAPFYTYLPQIGLYLALTWLIGDLTKSWHRRWILTATATAVIAFFSWTAWIQTSYWCESESLWKHTLAVTGNNETAHSLLGDLALEKGLIDEAAAHYQAAVNVWPSSPTFQAKLGKALLRKGLNDEAIVHFQKAIELASHRTDTDRAELQADIGNELLQKGLVDEV